MSKHTATPNDATTVLEARAVSLAEHGQIPDGFGRHRATPEGLIVILDELRIARHLLVAS